MGQPLEKVKGKEEQQRKERGREEGKRNGELTPTVQTPLCNWVLFKHYNESKLTHQNVTKTDMTDDTVH